MIWYTDGNGFFYTGDIQPGDRVATDEEVAAYQAAQAAAVVASKVYSFLDFMGFFTQAEQVAIMTARRTDVQVDLFVTMAAGSGGLQMSNPQVAEGVYYLASINLVAADRVPEILGAAPQAMAGRMTHTAVAPKPEPEAATKPVHGKPVHHGTKTRHLPAKRKSS